MIGILACQHIRQQTWTRTALFNRTSRQISNYDAFLAVFTCILDPNVLPDNKRSRYVIQFLGHFLSDGLLGLTTAWADHLFL
jgi:hypothetical protein